MHISENIGSKILIKVWLNSSLEFVLGCDKEGVKNGRWVNVTWGMGFQKYHVLSDTLLEWSIV